MIIAFLERDGFEVAFFILYANEWVYGDGRKDKVTIEYIDSVKYFEPSGLRTDVYQKIVISYLRHAGETG